MNSRKWFFNQRICWMVLVTYAIFALIPNNAEAFLAASRFSSGEAITEQTLCTGSIQAALEHKIVAQRLADFGLTRDEVLAKLEGMSSEQLHQLAGLSHDVGGGATGTVIGILVIIILVIVILRLSDRRIVIQ